jgi:hypothetical protein
MPIGAPSNAALKRSSDARSSAFFCWSSSRIAARDLLGVRVARRQEDHRGVLVAVAALDQLDRLEAVEPGHAHVHHDHREVVVQQALEGILARRRGDHLTPERLKHGPQRHEALGLVVDDQDRARAAHPARFL